MTEIHEVAQAVLDAHDRLRESHAREPELDEDNRPVENRQPWLEWHANDSKPAYEAWSKAMDRLEELLGDEFPGRHPFSFRPVCERIVSESADVGA